jgi:hypothetical protein
MPTQVPQPRRAAVQRGQLGILPQRGSEGTQVRFPNLVIGGAPKCGTTSVFDWLVAHPEVCGSKSKEPFFLMDEEHPLRRKYLNIHDHGLEAYARAFPKCTERQKIVVDGSSLYIYQKTAIDVLAKLPTRPRVLFLVRKPSERIFSLFNYYKNKANLPKDLSFPDFVARISNLSDPRDVLQWASRASPYVLPLKYSQYVDFLAEWRERLDDQRVRVMLFETIRADPRRAMQDLCRCLGIDPSFYDDFQFAARNRTSSIRSYGVQRVANFFAGAVRSGPTKEAIKRLYYGVQSTGQREDRTAADEAAMAQLDDHFRPFNERLGREFGLDLEAWS